MKHKPLPIGVEDFKRLVDNGYYFVDKTLMIKELLENKESVNLFTRPRRFGKTLNMSMLQRFFEATENSNAYLFDGSVSGVHGISGTVSGNQRFAEKYETEKLYACV